MTARIVTAPASIEVQAWKHTEEWLSGSEVVGRALVRPDGGGLFHALRVRHGRHEYAVWWDRPSESFVWAWIKSGPV